MTQKQILISDDLRTILSEIQNDSQVAKLLLSGSVPSDQLVTDPVNWISISREDRTKISYVTSERANQIPSEEIWTSSRRFQAKPGAFVGKVFSGIPGREIEKFSNLFISQVKKPTFTFKVVRGEIIKDYYYFESYEQDSGSLGASCMKHEQCQKFLDIYTQNEEVSMLLMLHPSGRLMGRAILWNFDSYKIMDRIYTVSDEELAYYFKQWANSNGYLYKQDQNWFSTCHFEQSGKRQELKLELKLKNWKHRYYPYMDTFKFMCAETGTLYNWMNREADLRTLCSSEGSRYEGDYLRWDGIDQVCRYSGDSVWVEYKRFYTHQRNCEWSEINDTYIINGDWEYDEQIGEYIFNKSLDRMNNQERIKEKRDWLEKRRSSSGKTKAEILRFIEDNNLSLQLDDIV
jgi:hypothetical protein